MRVLAVCAASTLDTALRADEQGLGPVEELLHSCPNVCITLATINKCCTN